MSGRTAVWILIALVALGALVYGFWPAPVEVETTRVLRGTLTETVTEEGKTRVKDRYVVSSPVAGYSRRVDLEPGDPVEKGQTLVEIEPRRAASLDPRTRAEARARVSAAESAVKEARHRAEGARADAALALKELKRVRPLFKKGLASRDALDKAEAAWAGAKAAYRSARFAVEVAEYELGAARTALEYAGGEADPDRTIPVKTPVEGRVLKVIRESEGAVREGEPLLEVGDPGAIEVETELLSTDAVKVAPGTRVIYERWGGEEDLEGRVTTVEPSGFTKISALGVEEQRVLVISNFTSPQETWKRLGDAYRVESVFVLWEGKDVLKAPSSALFRRDDHWAVFVVEDDRARLRDVGVGHRGSFEVEITRGLNEGEEVITHPDEAIEDGSKVRVR